MTDKNLYPFGLRERHFKTRAYAGAINPVLSILNPSAGTLIKDGERVQCCAIAFFMMKATPTNTKIMFIAADCQAPKCELDTAMIM
ncbi:MAG: hypothetical protein CMD66_09335 [Gammaproteobacteria bacterium]|nr:hypothetical protein [Gammaproteobacteria bacterium]